MVVGGVSGCLAALLLKINLWIETRTHTHIYIYTYTHTYIYTHTHTHTHRCNGITNQEKQKVPLFDLFIYEKGHLVTESSITQSCQVWGHHLSCEVSYVHFFLPTNSRRTDIGASGRAGYVWENAWQFSIRSRGPLGSKLHWAPLTKIWICDWF